MASTGERMTQSLKGSAFSKATDLQNRIWFTLGALIIYRLGTYIPLPGINSAALKDVFSQHSSGLLGMFDMFTGGALSRMTIFALNIMPYISASIIMQLMTTISPSLGAMKKEGANGSKRINQYTRYLTVLITAIQAYGISAGLESMSTGVVIDGGWFFRFTTVVTLMGGTMFLMWLGEQITQRGVGNGISLIIFTGIVANLPHAVAGTLELGRTGALSAGFIIGLVLMVVAVIFLIVFVERAQRRIIVQYPKRQQGGRMTGGENTHLPLKINTAGVIPPIFAGSILGLPVTILGLSAAGQGPEWVTTMMAWMGRGQPAYLITFVVMIVFFAFFYTAVVFNPEETADNLKKYGGFVPGIRPGKSTSDYLDKVLTRLTVIGSAYLAAICLLPEILMANYSVPFYFGGTSLLIVVTVTMDTVTQVQSHLMAHQYEGLVKKAKLRGKRK